MKNDVKLMPVDNLGRVVIPVHIRTNLQIVEKDKLEVFTKGRSIIFQKPIITCVVCNTDKNLFEFEGQLFCGNCIKKMTQMLLKSKGGIMVNNLKMLDEQIVKKREELNLSIEQNKSKEYIYQKSIELDNIIAEYIQMKSINI